MYYIEKIDIIMYYCKGKNAKINNFSFLFLYKEFFKQ